MARLPIPPSELFDPTYLESLRHLRIVARRVARGGRHAEQRSKDLGGGLEFRDYRPYTPGDDFRVIDWNIYRRLGRVFVRLFEEFEDLPVYLAPDISSSMALGERPRARAGLRCALGLASIALSQHDSVGIFPFADDMGRALRPAGGRARLARVAEVLSKLDYGGVTDFRRSMQTLRNYRLREGLLVVISDFFDPAGAERAVDALGLAPHRLLMVQLVRATDREPSLEGDIRLVDCETEETDNVSISPTVLEGYARAHRRFEEVLSDYARRRGAGLLRLDVDRPVLPQLAGLFGAGALRA